MRISFLPLARDELDEAFLWYEEQVVGLGYEFLDEFDQSVRLIVSFPNSFELIEASRYIFAGMVTQFMVLYAGMAMIMGAFVCLCCYW